MGVGGGPARREVERYPLRGRSPGRFFSSFCAVQCLKEGCGVSFSGGQIQAPEEVGRMMIVYYDGEDADSLRSGSYLRMDRLVNRLWEGLMGRSNCYQGWRIHRKGSERGCCLSLRRERPIPRMSGGAS